ncbi:MAG: GAF domain-containing protein [Anaeromyxobacteraceae bacterium]
MTDSTSGRVFRIVELAAGATPPAPIPAAAAPAPQPPAPPPPVVAKPAPPPPAPPKPAPAPPAPAPVAGKPAPAPKPAAAHPERSLAAGETKSKDRPRPSAEPKAVEEVARPSTPPPAKIGRKQGNPREELLAELFEAVSTLEGQKDCKAALAYLLDLAMERLGCDAGSVFLSRLGEDELHFEVVRGPAASSLASAKLTVPVGVGIVGYCAQENVCLAVSDAQKDRRFHRAISEAIGYETRSLLCAPIARENTVLGAIEVLNKRGAVFDAGDLAALAYLAAQAAEFLHRLDR